MSRADPMTRPLPLRRKAWPLIAVLALQAMAAVFFVGDVLFDILDDGLSRHIPFEVVVCTALVAGMVFGAVEVRRTVELVRSQGAALRVASGELHQVITAQFRAWGPTPAETDVAMLALKGLDVDEIAGVRGAEQRHRAGAADARLCQGGGVGAGAVRGLLRRGSVGPGHRLTHCPTLCRTRAG
jgi:hypothetical protein